jgi:hypothetical protein
MAISTAELVELARGRGAAVTPRQIERWRYEGLLPRAERKGLGRGRGTAWVYTDDVVTGSARSSNSSSNSDCRSRKRLSGYASMA